MCDENAGMTIVRLILIVVVVAAAGTWAAYEYDRHLGLQSYCRTQRAQWQHIVDTTCLSADKGQMKGTARDCEELETKLRAEDVKICATREWWDRHWLLYIWRGVVECVVGQSTAVIVAGISGMAMMAALIYFVIRLTSTAARPPPYYPYDGRDPRSYGHGHPPVWVRPPIAYDQPGHQLLLQRNGWRDPPDS